MLKTIVFDFDGTIADSLNAIFTSYNDIASLFGERKIKSDEIETFRSLPIDQAARKYFTLWKLPFFLFFFKRRMKREICNINPVLGIREALTDLKKKGFKLGIVSSNLKSSIEEFLKTNNLEFFDFIHSESNLFNKSKALKNLLHKLNLSADEMIYVGDEVRDIKATKKIGVDIISVSWGLNNRQLLEKHKPKYLVDEPLAIRDIILKL